MKNFIILIAVLSLIVCVGAGCGDDTPGGNGDPDASSDAGDAGETDTGTDPGNQLFSGACADANEHMLELNNADGFSGAINPAGDIDYIGIEVEEGDFLSIFTFANFWKK